MIRINREEIEMKAPISEHKEFEKHPATTVATVCTKVLDMGTHWNDGKQKNERKLRIDFESTELMKTGDFEGKPFLLINNFNFSMYSNSRLCQFVEAWLGRKFVDQKEADGFDLDTLLGKTALCNVIHSDDGKWVNIGSIMPVPAGMTAPAPVGALLSFDCDKPNPVILGQLSQKVQEKINASHEIMNPSKGVDPAGQDHAESEANPPPITDADLNDSIPF